MAQPLSTELLDGLGLVDGRSLPGGAFVDPSIHAWEMRELWADNWVCLGRADQIAATTQQAIEVGSEQVLVTFDATTATVRAFPNVCAHRGHELLACAATSDRPLIVCPYHAWSYDLAGSLRSIGRGEPGPDFSIDEWSLRPYRVETWRGWAFINLNGEATPLTDQIGELDDVLAPYAPEELRVAHTITYDVAANWKIFAANYHECYHCPGVHPELSQLCDIDSDVSQPSSAGNWIGGPMLLGSSQTLSTDGRSVGPQLPGLDAERAQQVWLGEFMPSLFIAAHPDYLITHRVMPAAPGHTRISCDWLTIEGTDAVERAVQLWDLTNRQDWEIVESIQRAAAGTGFRPGPLLENETSVRRYEATIANAYRTGRLRAEPA